MFPFETARIGLASILDWGHAEVRGGLSIDLRCILNASWDGDAKAEASEPPTYFADLNLDQIIASITAGKRKPDSLATFYEPLKSSEAIEYRQGVMRDLESDAHYDAVTRFANTMRSVRTPWSSWQVAL